MKPIIENRILDEGHPFYAVKNFTPTALGAQTIELLIPRASLIKVTGMLLTANTNQTITAVYADIEDDAHLMLPALAGGADIDYSMIASAGKNMVDIYGDVYLRKKLIVKLTQATGLEAFKAEIYGARYPIIK